MHFKNLASDEIPVAEKKATKIIRIALLSGINILMTNDVPEIPVRTNENENRSKIVIRIESKEEADKLFNGLSASDKLKYLFLIAPGVHILVCSEKIWHRMNGRF